MARDCRTRTGNIIDLTGHQGERRVPAHFHPTCRSPAARLSFQQIEKLESKHPSIPTRSPSALRHARTHKSKRNSKFRGKKRTSKRSNDPPRRRSSAKEAHPPPPRRQVHRPGTFERRSRVRVSQTETPGPAAAGDAGCRWRAVGSCAGATEAKAPFRFLRLPRPAGMGDQTCRAWEVQAGMHVHTHTRTSFPLLRFSLKGAACYTVLSPAVSKRRGRPPYGLGWHLRIRLRAS